MDNLNTHTMASLYQAFEPAEARRIAQRLEIHYTPKHGSWLNIAEIELSGLTQQCLGRRIPDIETLPQETHAWASRRNAQQKGVDWQFTTEDARIKLKRLYPKFNLEEVLAFRWLVTFLLLILVVTVWTWRLGVSCSSLRRPLAPSLTFGSEIPLSMGASAFWIGWGVLASDRLVLPVSEPRQSPRVNSLKYPKERS